MFIPIGLEKFAKNGHKEMAADPKILKVESQDLVWIITH